MAGVPLHVQLAYHHIENGIASTTPITGHNPLEILKGSMTEVWPGAIATLKYSLKETSQAHNHRHFAVVVSSLKNGEIDGSIRRAISGPFKVVNFKLAAVELSGVDADGIWYKDQGGKLKALCVHLKMLDRHGRTAIPSAKIPLRCKLLYGNGQEVGDEGLLNISPDCIQTINKDGRGEIRYRIEDVSKNHQKNSFCVLICPDYERNLAFSDIAPVLTPPVIVKSKMTKKQKPERENPAPQPPPPTLDYSQVCSSTLQSALAVTEWVNGVIEGLETMEWKACNYESKACGESEPVYRCPACNVLKQPGARHQASCFIAQTLLQYTSAVRGHFEVLMNAAVEAENMRERGLDERPASPLVSPPPPSLQEMPDT
jgi:hypothetical protein